MFWISIPSRGLHYNLFNQFFPLPPFMTLLSKHSGFHPKRIKRQMQRFSSSTFYPDIDLASEARFILYLSFAPPTHRSYNHAKGSYELLCRKYGYIPFPISLKWSCTGLQTSSSPQSQRRQELISPVFGYSISNPDSQPPLSTTHASSCSSEV